MLRAFTSELLAALAALPLAAAAAAATATVAAALVHQSVVEVLRAVPESVHVGHARDADDVLVLGAVPLDTVAEGLDLVAALLLELLETENPANVSGCGLEDLQYVRVCGTKGVRYETTHWDWGCDKKDSTHF